MSNGLIGDSFKKQRDTVGFGRQCSAGSSVESESEFVSFKKEKENVGLPGGVNELLVRSLGWVQLPQDKEKMVGEVASALNRLGVRYSIERGELSDVVWAGGDLPAGDESVDAPKVPTQAQTIPEEEDVADCGGYPTGQLTVRIRINHARNKDGSRADHLSNFHVSRFCNSPCSSYLPSFVCWPI